MRPCRATRAGTQAPPLPISTKPRGVPLPHRGCTFDSAGSASATQPTLGNNASEEATPLGVVLFLIAHHYHTRRMDYSRMISHTKIDFKKYNADGIGCLPPTFPRVASYRRQPWAGKSTTPMVLVHVHRFPNKQNHPRAIWPNETVGAAPACPPERPHSGVSIRK